MSNPRNGPPIEVEAGIPNHQDNRPSTNNSDTTNPTSIDDTAPTEIRPGTALRWVPCTRTFPQDIATQLKRRRDQANRSVPLDCGCRDGWTCRCTDPPVSERALDAWRDAAEHVLETGRTPLLPLEVRRALWRRGGHDRQLAELLHDACGEMAT
jgi:hypothetical protein